MQSIQHTVESDWTGGEWTEGRYITTVAGDIPRSPDPVRWGIGQESLHLAVDVNKNWHFNRGLQENKRSLMRMLSVGDSQVTRDIRVV